MMSKSDRTARLFHLHELVLQQAVARQKNAANVLQEQNAVLAQLQSGIENLDQDQPALSRTGHEALLWHYYFGLLQEQKIQQTATVVGQTEVVERFRQQTTLAYQDAKRWEIHHEQTIETIVSERDKYDLRQADDLAVSRTKPI